MHRLGPYLLLTRIGVGGMAEIFLARRGDQVVALKRILPHLAANDEFVDMFVDEARMAARLRHPNIARVLDVGREQGLWYIAMEYVPGEDLLTIIRRSRSARPSSPTPRPRCTTPTTRATRTATRSAWSTATSRPPTSSSRTRATSSWSTSASPRPSAACR
jgi:serine/threonine protein kinase